MQKTQTQQTQLETAGDYFIWKVITAAISLATTITIFNIHPPKHHASTGQSDIKHMFERESEVLHMHPNYGARARYSVILGGE